MFYSASCSYAFLDSFRRLLGLHMSHCSPSKLSTSTTSTRPITRSMSSIDHENGETERPRTLSIQSDDFELPQGGVLSYVNGTIY